jgi:hypothetical protein
MSQKIEMPFRLALRVEGRQWVAYLALQDTMDGAEWLGAIDLRIVERHPEMKQAFIDVMVKVIAIAVKGMTGHEPEFVLRDAEGQ